MNQTIFNDTVTEIATIVSTTNSVPAFIGACVAGVVLVAVLALLIYFHSLSATAFATDIATLRAEVNTLKLAAPLAGPVVGADISTAAGAADEVLELAQDLTKAK